MPKDYQQLAKEVGENFADAFSSFVNGGTSDVRKHAINKMCREHRTLQQNMMRFFMEFVEEMAKNSSDPRNQDSVELAKAIQELPDRVKILSRV